MSKSERGPDVSDPRWKIVREWREPGQLILLTLDADHRACVYFDGKGSLDGAKALIDLVDRVRDEVGHDKVFAAIVDMRDLSGAPLRAQFVIGKWLFARKRQIAKIAVFGGRPFEMKVAQAVMTVARMKNASFFKTLGQAIAWLGWPPDVYADRTPGA